MKKLYSTILGAVLMTVPSVASAETLSVYPDADGTSTYLPLNIYYCSNNIHTQMIYPASELEGLKGKVIEKITFTITRSGSQWTSPAISVKMGLTQQSEYAETTYITEGLTEVAALSDITFPAYASVPYSWEIALDNPFTYTGDNLVLDFTNTKGSGPRNWTFAGAAQTTNTGISMTGSARLEKFLPKMTIEYSEASSMSAVVSTTNIFFPLTFSDEEARSTVKLTNTGAEPLNGTVSVTGEAFSIEPASFEAIPAGESKDFTVKFATDDNAGIFEGNITFTPESMAPITVALSGQAVKGPKAVRTIFNENRYNSSAPAGWATYAEETFSQNGDFSAGSTNYDDFGTTLRFESATVSGYEALLWNHANPMPFSELYTRAYYIVSPTVGNEITFGGTLNDVAATGAFIKAFEAEYNAAESIYTIGNEIDIVWDTPLAQGAWSNASARIPGKTCVAFLLKYAALNYFAGGSETSGVSSVTVSDDSDCPVEYFNLQGIKVENPKSGIYIRRQGNSTSKHIIR